MDIHRLQVFVKVYELESISRAAEEVYLSQPTVSGHIKALESELSVKLFDRLGRGVAPTRQAQILFDYARRIVQLRDEALAAVAGAADEIKGELLIGGSTIPGHYLLPAYLSQMRELYPGLTVRLSVADTRAIALGVASGELELAVIGSKMDDPKLEQIPCCRDEMILAGPPTLTGGRGRIDRNTLLQLPFLIREPGSGTRMELAAALERVGLGLSQLKIVAELGSTQAIRQAMLAGMGCSVLSRLAVEEDLRAGRLEQLVVPDLDLSRQFYMISRLGRSKSPGGRKLANLLLAEDGE